MRAVIIGGLNARSNHHQPPPPKNNPTTSTTRTRNLQTKRNPNVTTTPARPLPSPKQPQPKSSDRPPLQSRDNNAMMRGSQKGGLSTRSGISSDNKPASRPLLPTLSASSKAPNRPPLTPRVAVSSTTGAPASSLRRTPRPIVRSHTPDSSKEELPTPLSSYLTNNITPRSGPRKVRVDGGSANTTPTGTPTGTPGFPPTNDSFRAAQDATMQVPGLGISAMDKDMPKRSTVSFSTAGSEVGGYKRSPNAASADSKFFFASDAKPTQAARSGVPSNKPSSKFFHANGESIPPAQSTGGSVVGSNVGEEKPQPKFFHANGTPDLQLSPSPSFAPSRPVSVVSNHSRMPLSRATTFSSGTFSPPQRTAPPAKPQHANIPSQRSTPTLQAAVVPRPQAGGRGQSANSVVANRRSLEYPRVVSHGRSASLGSGPPSRKNSVSSPLEVTSPVTPAHIIPAGLVSTPEETPETSSVDDATSEHSESLQSPEGSQSLIKVGQTLEQLNELAANARRERKVLDLEITNSSLEAINRTLEREMRKQTAELRRFRRLSRSGRLSIAPASLRTSMDTLSVIGESIDGASLSGLSEDEDLDHDEPEEEEGYSDTSESMDDGPLSPAAMAESDLRHRKKDEKRLQLDLSKHQQLLTDSQRMNQSLKRCLGWTEALIDEGKKALEYRVIPGDVELGGRVLTQDEIEQQEVEVEVDNEGMSSIGARMLREARQKAAANAAASWGGEGKDDRDSGIEIDGTQREALRVSFGSPILQ
ncbi:hypothetical protein HYALB_00010898 [Hymenoscyphus albidus]|uniref:Uncharacterized protein n=1 Tax=Hymenoscyphus albidus TaxID=595503 RepID=A0A9N9PW93_9HELO|nr:hypothetical protein HYALB_00010898 [Hymenoscyphus albidus]